MRSYWATKVKDLDDIESRLKEGVVVERGREHDEGWIITLLNGEFYIETWTQETITEYNMRGDTAISYTNITYDIEMRGWYDPSS